jgi:predicted permease
MTPTFVEQFNGNATLAAKGTVLTTLGSFVVLPVLLALLPVI